MKHDDPAGGGAGPDRSGILCVVSGPSGSGKTTLCRAFTASDGGSAFSISCTTRSPRAGEVDGRDYHFLTPVEFERRVEAGEFLEHAVVHGNRYGTLRSSVLERLAAGRDVIMDIDTQGAAQVRASGDPMIRGALVDVFVLPPTMDELHARLAGRGTETGEQVALRLRNALGEIAHARAYGYTIVSGSRERDLERLRCIVEAERARTARLAPPEIVRLAERECEREPAGAS